jgi:hypothetical protein
MAFAGLLFLPGKRHRRWLSLAILLAASLGALTGCGGGFTQRGSTVASYTIHITATSGSDVKTATLQLTVQ